MTTLFISQFLKYLQLVAFIFALSSFPSQAKENAFKQVTFSSLDDLEITADIYAPFDNASKPFIILCHQARWSRGEYREIAPKLNALGFNCMAIDQRSGGSVNGVENKTAIKAKTANKGQRFVDAEQDILAAIKYAKNDLAKGKLILWGSSYSSSLVLRIAGKHAEDIHGTLSFAPGEYFSSQGKSANWIAKSAKKIQCPTFITSAKNEAGNWTSIYAAINTKTKEKFLPTTEGNHGSRALWKQFDDHTEYWKATKKFLAQFL